MKSTGNISQKRPNPRSITKRGLEAFSRRRDSLPAESVTIIRLLSHRIIDDNIGQQGYTIY